MTIAGLILAPLLALQAAPACATVAAPPPELAGWSAARPLRAGTSGEGAPAVTPGTAADIQLRPTAQLRYPVAPAKPGAAATAGGVFSLTIDRAGRYRIALGAGAWVDVVRDGAALASVAHGHGPACSGVRKMVDYDLAPGRYLIQLAGSTTPTIRLMVARLR
ncbi:hypothetical protein GGQ80_001558 [Sphingomonas jinjuensis]|uniref:Homogentisate 1,2-dioxygenase n=1 Tax=Sphingomonas jinjuensis TaxID=535907 RepID=A0A840FAJ8_9SPHN|nr:homogentisate 1,2-dioxygenase [Sphingomonas jinjuensis]MBB4153652.1 hypothetical protein [Sphingomonas jinjuensis]